MTWFDASTCGGVGLAVPHASDPCRRIETPSRDTVAKPLSDLGQTDPSSQAERIFRREDNRCAFPGCHPVTSAGFETQKRHVWSCRGPDFPDLNGCRKHCRPGDFKSRKFAILSATVLKGAASPVELKALQKTASRKTQASRPTDCSERLANTQHKQCLL